MPILPRKGALLLERKSVKRNVVPLPGSRWKVVMARFGNCTPGFSFANSGWFQRLISPEKMPARTLPEKRSFWLAPETL